MNERFTHVSLLLIITLLLSFCTEDPTIDSEVPDSAATKKMSKPTANAGIDVSLKLPTNTTALDGSLSVNGDYPIRDYQWSKISGPDSYSIAEPLDKKTSVSSLTEGVYVFELMVIDDHNFRDKDEVVITVSADSQSQAPTLSGFTPSSGAIGATVILTGNNFGASPLISFNGVPASILTSTTTSITTVVPAAATSGAISVSANGQTISSSSPFNVLSIPADDLYFHGTMDGVSITTTSSGLSFNGWSELKNNLYISGLYLNNIGGTTYAFQEIRKDPVDPTKNVLYAQVLDDDPNVSGTTRAQMTLRFINGVNLPVYHTSHRVYLNPDINELTQYPDKLTWFTVFEIWNVRNEAWDGDPAGSARWSLSLFKETGTDKPLFWHISAEHMQPANIRFKDMWIPLDNRTAPVPFGQWFTLDLYMKRGEGADGKLVVKITPDGGPTTVVFDITNTTIYPGHPELQLYSWQPFKLYTSDTKLDWMRARNKSISAYYNDFKWYKN